MSARVTRKRPRTDTDDNAQPAEELNEPSQPQSGDAAAPEARVASSAQNADSDGGNGHVLKPDDEFWFDDGNVILVAGDVEFRIYKGLVADHSSVFKELFARHHPHRIFPIDATQSITCPVVAVSDSPHDLRHILRAYIPRQEASFFATVVPTFDQISASIRLGQKYKLAALYNQALQFLKNRYTDDFDRWIDHKYWVPEGWDMAHAIGVVNLARLIGEPSLLPTALLTCTQLGTEIVRGFRRPDGTQENLTLEDLGLLYSANVTIREFTVYGAMQTLKSRVSANCKTRSICLKELRNAFLGLDSRIRDLLRNDPFWDTDAMLKDNPHLCSSCVDLVHQRSSDKKRIMWNRLPELLGIEVPGWGQQPPPQAPAA